jgi:hypothetical protein
MANLRPTREPSGVHRHDVSNPAMLAQRIGRRNRLSPRWLSPTPRVTCGIDERLGLALPE